jgi:hypothetical protein
MARKAITTVTVKQKDVAIMRLAKRTVDAPCPIEQRAANVKDQQN